MLATHILTVAEKKSLREKKVGFAEKKPRLWLAELPCMATLGGGGIQKVGPLPRNDAPLQEGGLPFWVFSVAIIWRRWVSTGLWALFGFGPKSGGFVVQKRNETPVTPETLETPETLSVDVRIVVL